MDNPKNPEKAIRREGLGIRNDILQGSVEVVLKPGKGAFTRQVSTGVPENGGIGPIAFS